MKAFSKLAINNIKSKCIAGRFFSTSVFKLGKSHRSIIKGDKQQFYATSSMNLRNFSEKKKENEESKEKKENQDTSDDDVNPDNIQEKYLELKNLYKKQSTKLNTFHEKFEELRAVYLSNVEETEQIKVRSNREIAQTKEFAISKFAKDLLDVHDNFQRAMDSVADKEFSSLSEQEKNETYKNFLEGKFNFNCRD